MSILVYFLIWGAFFFFMMRFGCGAHIMGHSNSHRHEDRNPNDPNIIGVTSNTQPIANAERNNEHQH